MLKRENVAGKACVFVPFFENLLYLCNCCGKLIMPNQLNIKNKGNFFL